MEGTDLLYVAHCVSGLPPLGNFVILNYSQKKILIVFLLPLLCRAATAETPSELRSISNDFEKAMTAAKSEKEVRLAIRILDQVKSEDDADQIVMDMYDKKGPSLDRNARLALYNLFSGSTSAPPVVYLFLLKAMNREKEPWALNTLEGGLRDLVVNHPLPPGSPMYQRWMDALTDGIRTGNSDQQTSLAKIAGHLRGEFPISVHNALASALETSVSPLPELEVERLKTISSALTLSKVGSKGWLPAFAKQGWNMLKTAKDGQDREAAVNGFSELRGGLSPSDQDSFDRELRQIDKLEMTKYKEKLKRENPNHPLLQSPCQTLCKMASNYHNWSKKEFFINPEFKESREEWENAMIMLQGLFFQKAARYCPKVAPLADQFSVDLLSPSPKKKVSPEETKKTTPPMSMQEMQSISSHLPDEQRKTLQEFMSRGISETSKPADMSSRIYRETFTNLYLLDRLRDKKLSESERSKLEELRSSNEKALKGDIVFFEKAQKGRSGSLFNSYGLLSSLLAVSWETLSTKTGPLSPFELSEKRPEDLYRKFGALTPPYYPDINYRERSKSAAAGTAPLMNLELFLRAEDPVKKREYEKSLKDSVENFLIYAGVLREGTKHNKTHVGLENHAPYYFYPALPYVTAALKILIERSHEPNSTELKEWLQELTDRSLKNMDNDGVLTAMGSGPLADSKDFPARNATSNAGNDLSGDGPLASGESNLYHSSPLYIHSLAGLSLVSACAVEKGDPSYGVVDLALEYHPPSNAHKPSIEEIPTHPFAP
jgi:hypothetical protein